MKPKVLFVSRERFRLPLDGAQKRKWDAVASVVEHRVLAAAAPGSPTRDAHFHLVGAVRFLDGPLFYLLLPWRIARQLRRFAPDAALVQGIHETVAFLIARRLTGAGTKVILDVQGDWHEATRLYGSRLRRLLNPLNDALAAPAVRGADAVRTVSTQTTGLVRGLGVEPAAVFPSYTDAQAFLDRPPAPLPERPRALFVGVLERYKGFDTLAAAWPVVRELVPEATLHVVSDGSLRQLVPAGSEWSKRLTAEEVAAAMDDSWLFCLPSRSEGLPRVALEAAARGRAIVGGNRAGIPDVVEDGVNGLLIDPDDPQGLADALVRILSDREYAGRLGAAARRTGEEWGVTPAEYAEKLRTLIACASRSSSS
jgi:glycosyltransferase involved in cell wall biosynthesis